MATRTKTECVASGEAMTRIGRAGDYVQDLPDGAGRVKCPICGKLVKLRRDWPARGWYSIPRHLSEG